MEFRGSLRREHSALRRDFSKFEALTGDRTGAGRIRASRSRCLRCGSESGFCVLQTNQEDLLQHLQQQIEHFEPDERQKVFRRLASYMLNLSPIGYAQALQHARVEAEHLLADDRTSSGGLKKLVANVLKMLEDRSSELSEIRHEIRDLARFVEVSIGTNGLPSKTLAKAVAALAYLRNPYDRFSICTSKAASSMTSRLSGRHGARSSSRTGGDGVSDPAPT